MVCGTYVRGTYYTYIVLFLLTLIKFGHFFYFERIIFQVDPFWEFPSCADLKNRKIHFIQKPHKNLQQQREKRKKRSFKAIVIYTNNGW